MDRKELVSFALIVVLGVVIVAIISPEINMFAVFNLKDDSATFSNDVYFTIPDTVFISNERIEMKGYLYQSNYSSNGSLLSRLPVFNVSINLTIRNTAGVYQSNYTFTTDANGTFYSRSNFYPNAALISAPSVADDYYIRAEYLRSNTSKVYSDVQINVVNKTLDTLKISSDKAVYAASENIKINIKALKQIGDKTLHISNVSVNGSLRNSTKYSLQTFNCTTGSTGKCTLTITAPSTGGDYLLELGNFKAYSSFSVAPFLFNAYMKDELGESVKNIYATGEQGRVEVSISNASSSDLYTFSGYIADSSGNNIKTINSTTLNSNNSFINSFLFTVDSITFNKYGAYRAYVTVSKDGGGSGSSSVPFEVQDWSLSINKKSANSGFEYSYSTFPNKTIKFEAYPTSRSNGSMIQNISSGFFTINLKDNLNNILSSAASSWNASCGKEGCYEFSLNSPINIGEYKVYVALSYGGSTKTESQAINVIDGVMSSQSTDKDGSVKELFGTNEYFYITVTAYNSTASQFNLSNAEIFSVNFMNGSEVSYNQTGNFDLVNSTNSAYEWAWNSTLQRIKMDVPKYGGVYDIFISGNNQSIGSTAKIVVNPYDSCIVPKDTAGQVSGTNYYVWQFKATDPVYFEIKLTQANNPLGKASAANLSANSSMYGRGSACTVDTTTKQVISNATLSVLEVNNMESNALESFNSTESTCQSSDNSGGYTCTVKPLTKWGGGPHTVKLSVTGQDGATSTIYGTFEARAFYMYGWSQNWQNSPSSNISINLQLYEAGSNWWGGGGASGGISGTVTVKKVEYMGSNGEWIWPPVNYEYNVSAINSSSISVGSGTISIPAQYAPARSWKTGNYRAVLQATTSTGDTDYGYAWFGVKLWDVYGQPVECTTTSCNYKSYFNSKENITLFIKISQAGNYNYWDNGGANIGGNVSIKVKKIQDCRTWPCKDLNSSQYSADTIVVNASSPWYWNANGNNQSRYLLHINTTSGTWGTGYYNVVLDVNGTDTGYAWFNTIAFYAETQPTDSAGTNYKYSIRSGPMYFNVTTTKSYKSWSTWYNGSTWLSGRYNQTDYVNTTVYDIVLRTWDQSTWQQKEYNYPEDINITSTSINGNGLLNISFLNGTWPSGYYNGELTLKNSQNESSTGWLWFNVQPFRVQISSSQYNLDSDQCINFTLSTYEPDWSSNTLLSGNYSIVNIYEDVWSGYINSRINYTNFTSVSFNASANITLCPSSSGWSSGSWGGYHYPNIVVRDNLGNTKQTGWLWFKAIPFQISWGSVVGGSAKSTNANIIIPVNLSKSFGRTSARGNLTRIYQWRYDNYKSTQETYIFSVGSCFSNVSGQCTINGTQNVTIYAPSGGWKVGYNYLTPEWSKEENTGLITDSSGIYIEGRESYNGYFENSDINGYYKYDFANNENITIRVRVRDSNYNSADVNITNVQYALSSDSCGAEWCRTYTDATWGLVAGGRQTSAGSAIITIKPSSTWAKGYYYIKALATGSAGSITITGGYARVKDMVAPNVTLVLPAINGTYYVNSTMEFNAITTENSQCSAYLVNYNMFYSWYCNNWNATNSTNQSISNTTMGACNTTKYNYAGSTYYTTYVSNNYYSTYNGSSSTWLSGATGFVTGTTNHTYTFNTTGWTPQHYGLQVWCYDNDYNSGSTISAFRMRAAT